MRRADRLCVASFTLYSVRQRPDTKGAPPLYLTPLPNGPFPWRPPDWYRYPLLPSDQHALPSRSVAGLPVLLCIGCDAQLACASRLSHFTLLGNDPTLRGLHPLYLTPLPNGPFPWCPPDCYRCQRTPTGHATLGGEIAPALTPPRARMSTMPRPMMRSRTLDIPHHALVQRSRTPP